MNMSYMFDGCGNLASLDLSGLDTGKVMNMHSMFDYCVSLASLDLSGLDTSKVTNMSDMFMSCNNLVNLELSGLDTSKVTNMGSMFSYCKSLKSLDLSDFDMSNVVNVKDMLHGCYELTLINTPRNIPEDIEVLMPDNEYRIWYRSDGSVVNTLPTGLSHSIVLQKGSVPVEKNQVVADTPIAQGTAVIFVGDRSDRGMIPISGAQIMIDNADSYITGDDGRVELQLAGSHTISVEKEGYISKQVQKTFSTNTSTGNFVWIDLYQKSSDLTILSATLNVSGEDCDLLNTSNPLCLTYTALDQVKDGVSTDLVFTVTTQGKPVKYQLIQNGKVLMESEDGTFKVQGKYVKDSDNSYTYYAEMFSAGNMLCVKVIDENGKSKQLPLSVSISNESYNELVNQIEDMSATDSDAIKEILGHEFSVDVSEDVPILGGADSTLKFGLKNLPFAISVDREQGIARIAVNMGEFDVKDDKIWNDIKQEYNNAQKRVKQTFISSNSPKQKYGVGAFSANACIMGYGEGQIIELDNSVDVTIGLIVEMEGSDAYTKQSIVSFVPVAVTFDDSTELSAQGELTLTYAPSSGFTVKDSNIALSSSVSSRLVAGVRVESAKTIGVSGSLMLDYAHTLKPMHDLVKLSGNAMIHSALEAPITVPFVEMAVGSRISSEDDPLVLYDSDPKAKMVGSGALYSAANSKTLASARILDYAYQEASPRILKLGDRLFLFYLDGVEGREAQNQTALFYRISDDNGVTWSEAARADNGVNETADCDFDIATDGTDIYALWSDAGDVYGEEILSMDSKSAVAKLGREMDLMLSVIDGSTGTVRDTSVISTDSGDLLPKLFVDDSKTVTAAWITNDASAEEGLLSTANKMGICYASSVDNYQVRTLSLGEGQYPQTLDVGLLGTKVCIAAGLDTDGNLGTQDDRDIYIAYTDTDGQLSALNAPNGIVDSVPLFGNAGGQSCLFWYQDGCIVYTVDGQTTLSVLTEEYRHSSGQDFSLLESAMGDGGAVVWTTTSNTTANGVDVYCADLDGEVWSAPYRLGELDSEFTTHLDGWLDSDGGYHLTYMGSEYADDKIKAHICLDEPEEIIDTTVTWYAELDEKVGEVYPLHLVVTNNGNHTVESLKINSKDGSIQDVLTDLDIAAGTSGEVTWDGITLPETMTEIYTQELTVLADGETDAGDNSISLSLGAPDFAIEVSSDYSSGDLIAGVMVSNSGILPADAVIRIYQDEAHEKEIFSTGIMNIGGGEIKVTMLDMSQMHELTPTFYFTVSDSKGREIYTSDNEAFLYAGKGLWLEYDNDADKPDDQDPDNPDNPDKPDDQDPDKPDQPDDPDALVLKAEKTQTVYEYGDELKLDDLTVTLGKKGDETAEPVTEYTTNADELSMLKLGEQDLVITYGEYRAAVTITVEPRTLNGDNTAVTLSDVSYVYDGMAKEPLPQSVKVNGAELVNGTDYAVSWSDNINIGTATLTITGQGNYRGTLDVHFEITKEEVKEEGGYTVSFDLNGHGTLAPITGIRQGSLIDEPQPPEAQGYRFAGWYRDSDCTVSWQFDTDVVEADLTLYADWRVVLGGGSNAGGETGGDIGSGEGVEGGVTSNEELSVQDIRSQTYTGKAIKPTVRVYFGEDSTPLKAGSDYTIKYFNNIDADTSVETLMGGISSDGVEGKQGFTKQLAYVVITGKGNYKGTVYQNFHIAPASLSNKDGDAPAAGFTLKCTEQLVTNAKKSQKPFTSLKYKKAMKAGKDYEVVITALAAFDGANKPLTGESVVARSTETGVLPAIPAGCHGSFVMRVAGLGNYAGAFEKTIYVTDKSHLMKNVSVTLGKNQKKVEYTGQDIVLRAGYYDASAKAYYTVGEDGAVSAQTEPNGDNVFTVRVGREYLLYGRDYTVSFQNNRGVGTATMILTGKGDYAGSKSVTFRINGKAFNAKATRVDGFQSALTYNGRALTQSGVTLTDTGTGQKLIYGQDYTVTYKNNVKKGTATMTFTAKASSGYSGSFQKTFRVTAATLPDTVTAVAVDTTQDKIVYEGSSIRLNGAVVYTREGVKPSGRVRLCNSTTGEPLKEGVDYTVTYRNNTAVSTADQAVMLFKGKNNYTGTLQIAFRISAADMIAQSGLKATTTAIAFNGSKAENYEYRPTVRLTDGKKALNAGKDYEVTYINCTHKAVTAYLAALSVSPLTGQSYEQLRPYARIDAKEGSGYQGSMTVDLTIYRAKLNAANLYVVVAPDARQTTYSGRQVTPTVTVYYGEEQAVKAARQAQETSENVLTSASGTYKLTRRRLPM
ncbi:MAG: BspA family leucine-rich repeat surface protein [Butyrivibrio sp.]|nr:BspA family leucine-rich repeat surface protein [Butyrivibrio sp.]